MKEFWRSKTFWVNALALVAAFLPPIREFLVTQFGLSSEWTVSLLAFVNVVLRFLTNQPITMRRMH